MAKVVEKARDDHLIISAKWWTVGTVKVVGGRRDRSRRRQEFGRENARCGLRLPASAGRGDGAGDSEADGRAYRAGAWTLSSLRVNKTAVTGTRADRNSGKL